MVSLNFAAICMTSTQLAFNHTTEQLFLSRPTNIMILILFDFDQTLESIHIWNIQSPIGFCVDYGAQCVQTKHITTSANKQNNGIRYLGILRINNKFIE